MILPDDLVIAKMHTQNGLYAFAKETFASTSTFIPFKIAGDKINKDYLFIILKMTLQRLQKFDSVNRETYTTNEILNLQIPLPPLDIQNKIVVGIQNIQAKIKALKEEEDRLKDEIEAYIYIVLGLSRQEIGQRQKVFIVNFKDLERWDIRHNQNNPHLVPLHCDCASIHSERSEESTQKSNNFFANAQNDNTTNKPKYPLVTLGEILDYERPDKYIVNSENYSSKFKIPVLTAGKSFILGYTNETNNIYKEYPVIIFDDFTTATKFVNFEFKVKSSAMKILRNKNDKISDIKFIFYAMQTIKLDLSLALRRHWISLYQNLKIPLPPLKIQQEIVAFIENKNQKIKSCKEKQITLQERLNSMLKESLL